MPALVRRRADGVAMDDVADPTFGMKPLCERGARVWSGIDLALYEMEPLTAVVDPSGNSNREPTSQCSVIPHVVFRTSNGRGGRVFRPPPPSTAAWFIFSL